MAIKKSLFSNVSKLAKKKQSTKLTEKDKKVVNEYLNTFKKAQ